MEALNFQWDFKDCPSLNGPTHYISGTLSEIKGRVARAAESILYKNTEGISVFCNKMEMPDREIYSIDVFSYKNGSPYTLASVHITPY
jgi:hypothetical protein